MFKAKVYKLKTTNKQYQSLIQNFGNCRRVYNRALNLKTTKYKEDWTNLSAFDIMKLLTVEKKQYEWLLLTPSQSLQHSITNMETAFKQFFKWYGFPRWKSKHSRQSFHIPQWIKIDYNWNWLFIPKIWRVKFFKDRKSISWVIKNATISKKADGIYISIIYDTIPTVKQETGKDVWIDMGLKDFIITSDWEKINSLKSFINSQKKLRKLQRHIARQKKWSNRRIKTKQQISILHNHISNQRLDFLHKVSTSIAKRYDTVYIENLNVKGMMKNRKLSKAIWDAWWSMFGTLLKYKTNVVEIGRFEPSSKLCSNCGNIYWELKLSEREWTCSRCLTHHDRDKNAAKNILQLGRKVFRD